jgi:hypothetical protein
VNAHLSTEQLPQVGGGTATTATTTPMTRCPWCALVWKVDGTLVDPKPAFWAALPSVPCSLCARLERICTKEPVAFMPMTREELANAGVVRKGRKFISVRQTLDAVSEGRSCLPASDRD